MKKIAHLMLLVGMAGLLAATAQTNNAVTSPPADWTNAPTVPAVEATTNTVIVNQASTPEGTVAALVTNVVTASEASTNTPPDTNAVMATAAPVPTATNATTEASAIVSAAAANGIPLIQFSDVPITTAIENLARQAGINYMMDPKIGYGQPDVSGQIKVEPQLSIRWENISAESALLALLDNYGLQLLHDKHTGIDRVTIKDPAAPPPLITRVIQLQYASVSNMTDSVQSSFTDKRSKVIGDIRTSQMVVVATDPEQSAVDALIKQLDRPTKQVLIETKLVEISSQPSTKKGVDWSSTLNAQQVTFGNGKISGSSKTVKSDVAAPTPGGGFTPTVPTTTSETTLSQILGGGGFSAGSLAGLVPATAFLNADGVNATISFLNATYNAQTMSTPRIVTLDNEMANLEVTRQFPIVNVGAGTQNASGSSSVTYSNVGTVLHVTPRISANDKIYLKIAPEVSSHFGDQTITVPGGSGNSGFSFTVPIFDIRRLNTQVLIPNGYTLVMGGLVQDNPTASYTKVPIMGDIPGLGWAFRNENKTMSKDNLIIFLTPSIVQDTDFAQTASDFLQSKPATLKMPMNPKTWWDSGEPRGNWSNPVPTPGEFDGKPKLNNF